LAQKDQRLTSDSHNRFLKERTRRTIVPEESLGYYMRGGASLENEGPTTAPDPDFLLPRDWGEGGGEETTDVSTSQHLTRHLGRETVMGIYTELP